MDTTFAEPKAQVEEKELIPAINYRKTYCAGVSVRPRFSYRNSGPRYVESYPALETKNAL